MKGNQEKTRLAKEQNLKIITLEVNVFEHNERRTASWFTSRIRRILTTLQLQIQF